MFLLISFLAAKKNKTIDTFMELLLLLFAWTGGAMFMRLGYWPSIRFWFHVSLVGILLLPISLFRFLRRFMEVKETYHMKAWSAVIGFTIAVNCRYEIFIQTPTVVKTEVGNAYIYDLSWLVLFLFVIEAGALAESIRMVYDNRKKNAMAFQRLLPIWIGIGTMVICNACIAFPVFRGFPIDICSGIVMAVCIYYALYKKRLFQLDLLVSKGNCYIMAFGLTMLIYYRFIPGYDRFLREDFHMGETALTMTVAFTVMMGTVLIYFVLSLLMNAVFENVGTLNSKNIRKFSERISHLMTLREIMKELMEAVSAVIPAEKTDIYLSDGKGGYKLEISSDPDKKEQTAVFEDDLLQLLRDAGGCLIVRDYKITEAYRNLSDDVHRFLAKNRIECMAAVRDEENYLGLILLTAKKHGERYTPEDAGFLASITSVASVAIENSKLYESVYMESRKDYLTGIANRKFFYEALQQCCEEGRHECGVLMMVDIDDFRLYNQLYGAESGDEALRKIAEILTEEVTQGCMASRYSGKEFALLLPDYTADEAKQLAERISGRVRVMNKSSGEYALKTLTVSCGIAIGKCPVTDAHELVNHAETAVYYAKRAGKNQIMVYTEGTQPGEELKQPALNYRPGVYSDYASTVYALTAAIDAKDHYTFSHSENVAYYARELAARYGMNEEGINIVYEAGLLHDIGKIGIEESILNKPGKLTKEEYETIKTHVALSIGIIRYLPSLDYVIPAVIGHHERYDGKGYPRHIQGDEIPLAARILCIADSFDAMVSKRTYKARMEVNKALILMEEEAGKQFDPVLVRIFIDMVKEGALKIR